MKNRNKVQEGYKKWEEATSGSARVVKMGISPSLTNGHRSFMSDILVCVRNEVTGLSGRLGLIL